MYLHASTNSARRRTKTKLNVRIVAESFEVVSETHMVTSFLFLSPFFFLYLVFALSPSFSQWSVAFRLCFSQLSV